MLRVMMMSSRKAERARSYAAVPWPMGTLTWGGGDLIGEPTAMGSQRRGEGILTGPRKGERTSTGSQGGDVLARWRPLLVRSGLAVVRRPKPGVGEWSPPSLGWRRLPDGVHRLRARCCRSSASSARRPLAVAPSGWPTAVVSRSGVTAGGCHRRDGDGDGDRMEMRNGGDALRSDGCGGHGGWVCRLVLRPSADSEEASLNR